ncbi:MAG: CoA-binding protein [Candidatus Omnitrophota bacterium]|jgi:hypothetical protein
MRVAVLGASDKKDRYSFKAVELLLKQGHTVFPVHQRLKTVQELTVYPNLAAVPGPLDTITLYVNAQISSGIQADILDSHPGRIIFNPGTENEALEREAKARGIVTQRACTILLLKSGQF